MTMADFFHEVGKLKDVTRSGWERQGVKKPESVADHTFRTILMVFTLAPKNLNLEKCLKIAIVHDLCDVYTDDIIVADFDGNTIPDIEDKIQKDEQGMQRLLLLTEDPFRNELETAWADYNDQNSPEAKFVKEVEKLEMAFQLVEYERKGHHMTGFLHNVDRHLTDTNLRTIFKELTNGGDLH